MPRRKIIYSLIFIALAVSIILFGIIQKRKNPKLEVTFLDVGQGDAILISRGDNQILIDGGPSGQKILEKLGENIPFWDRKIEMVMATHPDADHIAGLVDVMEKYEVQTVVDNGVSSDSQVYQKFKSTIGQYGINEVEGKENMKIKIGSEAEMEIMAPDGNQNKNNPKDTNATSIVSRLNYGVNNFLFTGDMSYDNEAALAESGKNLESNYLKVSHHGSKYATSQLFLDKVQPKVAIISVGNGNRYGHPSPDVMERLKENGIEIHRTDQEGDIYYVCQDSKNGCIPR